MRSKPPSEKTKQTHQREVARLLKANRKLVVHRQEWAEIANERLQRALSAEREVAEWKARFDKLLSREAEGKAV
jgi:hypothetical protein